MSVGRFFSDVCDGIPVVGHVKGLIHDIAGDEEQAKRAYMSATRSTLVLAGGALGSLAGPVGAAAAATYMGALTDTVVSAVTKKPVGIIRNAERLAEARNLGDVIVGVGRMGLDISLDCATGGSVGAATKSIARQSAIQLLKSAPKEAARQAARQAKEIGRQAVRHAAVGLVTNMQKPRLRVDSSDDDPSTDLSNISSEDEDSDEDSDEDEGFIYLFSCSDGKYKIGRTGRTPVLTRLNEHMRSGLIKPDSDITVYVCPRNVTKAETKILNEIRINEARITKLRKTEILDNRELELQYVKSVIRKVVAEVNHISKKAVKTLYFHFNSIEIICK